MALIMSLSGVTFPKRFPGIGDPDRWRDHGDGAGPRTALAVAGCGALIVSAVAWTALRLEPTSPRPAALPDQLEVVRAGAQPTPAARR